MGKERSIFMKRMKTIDLCLCAAMIALHVVLEVFCTIWLFGNSVKISLGSLPFIVIALLCGPVEGFVTGFIGTFISQLLTYGITITTPIWLMPGALAGLTAGLVYIAFKRKPKVVPIGVSVCSGIFVLTLCNFLGTYLDGVLILKYTTMEVLMAALPVRIGVGICLAVIYTLISVPVCKALYRVCPSGKRAAKKLKEKSAGQTAS